MFYQLTDIENSHKLIQRTLNSFAKDKRPPKQWLTTMLLSNHQDEHQAFDELEKLFKQIITSQLKKACVNAQLPISENVLVNHDGYRDRYHSFDLLTTTLQTEIGSNRQPEYQAVKIWSTLYHKYFVSHDLNDKRFATVSTLTSRQIRNYKREGTELLLLQLMSIEKKIIDKNQEQYQFQPQTFLETEADHLIGLARSARSLHGEQTALIKCEEAMQFACENALSRYYVKAAALKIFTLLQSGSSNVQKAATILEEVEANRLIKTLDIKPEKAWIMTKILGMWAHIWRRRGNLTKALESAHEAVAWLETLYSADTELSKDTYLIRGVMYWARGEYLQAESDFSQILSLQLQHKYDIEELLGLVNWSMCRFEQAEEYFQKAIKQAQTWQDHWHLACEQGNMGLIFLYQYQLKKSQYYIGLHRTKAEELKSWKEYNRATANLGTIYLHRHKYDLAIPLLEQARHMYDQMSSYESQVVIYTNLSQAYTMTGDHMKALSVAQSALNIADQIIGAYPPRLIALRCLAECELLDLDQRIHYLQMALVLSQEHRIFDRAACLLGLSWLYAKAGKRTSYEKEGIKLLHSIRAQGWLTKNKQDYPHLLLTT